ncbi:MAG: NAD-dependent DNA ligase LigA [Bdellovibrionales bacterium]|jgi:DNA ligase (NAD+)|nr:NAD-dependent DNA ligase LigA [Bdellovibrionales bacterium]MBT3525526.1 NAD-dependent DNA ligase LigA [Bdellovibrionales bacterium]
MDKIHKLEELIIKHKVDYYSGKPTISDIKYDAIEEELKGLCPDSPALKLVGSSPSNESKVPHKKKMLSLDKVYNSHELIEWIGDKSSIGTYKIDGVSCSLIYQFGKLVLAKTRGDGRQGEDITDKVLWMDSIPRELPLAQDGEIEVRGELFSTKDNFSSLAAEMENIGLARPSSRRNIVAGLISRKDHVQLARFICFTAFDLIAPNLELSSEEEKFLKLEHLNFDIPPLFINPTASSLEGIIEDTREFMSEGDYQIDGLVFSYNDLTLHSSLGETAHHPRYKIAYKFKGETAVTQIKKIEWGVSRNGVLTPVGIVTPVELSGAVISRVTLHNFGLLKQYNLKVGDTIEIIRSGEVIPKFLSVVKPTVGELDLIKQCPGCSGAVEIDDIRLRCINSNCTARELETILNFVQKIGIDDLSGKRLQEMLKQGLIKTIVDLYHLSIADLLKLEKFKDKLAKKVHCNIQQSMSVDLITFLSALGLKGGGRHQCGKVVASGIDTIEKIFQLTIPQLAQVESFAEKSATDFIHSLNERRELISQLQAVGFSFMTGVVEASGPLSGKNLCITGKLSQKRSVVEDQIRSMGGRVVTSVTSKTDYLLTNELESTSSKFKKAKQYGTPILTEEELFSL